MTDLENFLELPDVTEITEEIFVNDRLGKMTIKPMTQEQFNDYGKRCKSKINKKGSMDFDSAKFNLLVVAGQTIKPNFNNAELLQKAGCATASEFIQRKLLPGEISTIASKIQALSGFDTDLEEDIEEAKN